MLFSEYTLGLSPYISFGKSEADYFTELIGNFIQDAVMDSCVLMKRKPDTKYRYIRGDRIIQIKDAQFIYNHRDIKKFSSWIEERMGDTDSYDKIEEWLNQNGITTEFVPDACAELLETIILEIINPPASDVKLPPEVKNVVSETEIGGAELSAKDQELLQDFQADYDKIITQCIGERYAEIWIAENISKRIKSLYTDKWSTKYGGFQNLILRSWVIETLGLLEQICNTLDPNTNGSTITVFHPSVRQIRMKLRNHYVKLHPDQYVGILPYEAFVPNWADGED